MKMLSRRFLVHFFIALTLIGPAYSLSACSPGGLFSGDMLGFPHRPLPFDTEFTQQALQILSAGQTQNAATLTEVQFTNLLNELIQTDPSTTVRTVQVWFEPDRIYLKVVIREGVLPLIPTDSAINFEGQLSVRPDRLLLRIDRVGLGVFPVVPSTALDYLNQQLDRLLRHPSTRELPIRLSLERETITVDW